MFLARATYENGDVQERDFECWDSLVSWLARHSEAGHLAWEDGREVDAFVLASSVCEILQPPLVEKSFFYTQVHTPDGLEEEWRFASFEAMCVWLALKGASVVSAWDGRDKLSRRAWLGKVQQYEENLPIAELRELHKKLGGELLVRRSV